MSWPASIFERSSTSLISPSRCLPLRLHALQHVAHLRRRLAVDAVEDQLGVAEDGVERRAQLVAHVGEELRLVLARDLELPALLLDLAEQPRVLDRQHRLRRERLHQVDDASAGIRRARCGGPPARRRYRRAASSGTTRRAR